MPLSSVRLKSFFFPDDGHSVTFTACSSASSVELRKEYLYCIFAFEVSSITQFSFQIQ